MANYQSGSQSDRLDGQVAPFDSSDEELGRGFSQLPRRGVDGGQAGQALGRLGNIVEADDPKIGAHPYIGKLESFDGSEGDGVWIAAYEGNSPMPGVVEMFDGQLRPFGFIYSDIIEPQRSSPKRDHRGSTGEIADFCQESTPGHRTNQDPVGWKLQHLFQKALLLVGTLGGVPDERHKALGTQASLDHRHNFSREGIRYVWNEQADHMGARTSNWLVDIPKAHAQRLKRSGKFKTPMHIDRSN